MASKSDVVVKLVLVFFISLLSFSIGTFVGKKYSDNQHKLAALEPQHNESEKREVASVAETDSHSGTTTAHGSQKLSDEEIAKLAEEFVSDESKDEENHDTHAAAKGDEPKHETSTAKSQVPHPAPVAATTVKKDVPKEVAHATKPTHENKATSESHSEMQPLSAAKSLVHGKAPTEDEEIKMAKAPRLPTSLPKDVAQYSVGKYTVQIASYNNESEAKGKAEDLKEKGFSAFYVPATIKGKTWYRVSVGLFASEKEAKDYRSEFMNKAKVDSAIVQKIIN